MKKIVTEEIESRTALNRDMYCAKCGSHGYTIHHVLDDKDERFPWYIECESCGHTRSSTNRNAVIISWKFDNNNEPKRDLFRRW